jgi:hypothetical protein
MSRAIVCGRPGVKITDYERHVIDLFSKFLKDQAQGKGSSRCHLCLHLLKNCGRCKLCRCVGRKVRARARLDQ